MRLIDANALKRQFIDYVRTPPHFHYGDWQNMCINGTEIDEVIETAPTVDAVEVVRCKDCIQWSDDCGIEDRVCLKIYSDGAVSQHAWQERKPDDFCSYGERR